MYRALIFTALIFLSIGFTAAYFIFDSSYLSDETSQTQRVNGGPSDDFASNPFSVTAGDQNNNNRLAKERLDAVENDVALIKQQLLRIEQQLLNRNENTDTVSAGVRTTQQVDNRPYSALNRRLYKLENLIRGGIDPALAEDIVRKKNSVELKRLELQDRAKRNNYLNTQQYYDELESINQQDITLREVLGDDRYDEYLFSSKQNNRIKIASVMLGSTAEQAGIQQGDVVLSYDNARMFSWQELKDATTEGKLGEYVSISIDRDGEIYSFSVPRGPLGLQLGATRLQP